ncbi:hypothetical protein [Halocatena pleomorpha]|uniref:Uncharacterized protein n=1 Tax=Halocatena pleomorpha TaxID=1785090 RepID=A0A3P3RKL7_9EURY|nr:hypothetical protein [Halocatena pleomorpha]RRJ34061.1 hypothetical protein EIK79_00735 [Halocatena pleomorpha]
MRSRNISYVREQFSEQTKSTLDAAAKSIALKDHDHDVVPNALVPLDLNEDEADEDADDSEYRQR